MSAPEAAAPYPVKMSAFLSYLPDKMVRGHCLTYAAFHTVLFRLVGKLRKSA